MSDHNNIMVWKKVFVINKVNALMCFSESSAWVELYHHRNCCFREAGLELSEFEELARIGR